ncbi:hypothetical protein CMU04_06480 [Elizabethkingia anophelis]|nr:hypothetical protein [Elizabethkingia anophelis]
MEAKEMYPMQEMPDKIKGENHSKTVLVYDKDLEDFDLGYYDFGSKKWVVFGDFQMDLICWCYAPIPHPILISGFTSVLTD